MSTMETVPYHCQFAALRSKECRLCLMRPMREWQSSPHEEQMRVDASESVVVFSFRLVLFSMASLVILSSHSFSCLWRRQRQLLRSAAMCSQISGSIFKAFISRLHISLTPRHHLSSNITYNILLALNLSWHRNIQLGITEQTRKVRFEFTVIFYCWLEGWLCNKDTIFWP